MTEKASEVLGPSDPEDLKIITLARSALARTGGQGMAARTGGQSPLAPTGGQGACVRDTDGRTYAGSRVALPHLELSALTVAIAMAVSSGAAGLEAAAVAGAEAPTEADLAIVADLPGADVVVWHIDAQGVVLDRIAAR